ncbi:MAG: GNAT family N-acetyltransferase [Chloroflexi bacterium]|nr:GNAT family N-acetyltransferase [Chloroflexota bacterium]
MPIEILPAGMGDVEGIARLHRTVLGYTLNGELGEAHLRRLYRGLLISPHGVLFRAHDTDADGQPVVGFVSGADDAAALQVDLIRTPGTRIALSLAWGLVRRPWLVGKLITQTLINRPVLHQGSIVTATLTTVGVRPDYGRRGIGHQLVQALQAAFRARGVRAFHLNTLNTNTYARAFYRELGGRLVRTFRGNDIYLFEL